MTEQNSKARLSAYRHNQQCFCCLFYRTAPYRLGVFHDSVDKPVWKQNVQFPWCILLSSASFLRKLRSMRGISPS